LGGGKKPANEGRRKEGQDKGRAGDLVEGGGGLGAGRLDIDAGPGQRQRRLADLALGNHHWRHGVGHSGRAG